VWQPRLDGYVESPDGADAIQLASQFQLDDREPSPNVELYLKKNEFWEVILSGFGFETSTTGSFVGSGTFGGLVLNDGDPFSSTFEITSVAAELGITPWRPFATGHSRDLGDDNRTWQNKYIVDLRVSPQFGFRYIDVDQQVVTGGGSLRTGGDWAAITAGLDITMQWRPEHRIPGFQMFEMQASAAFGPALGDGGGFIWQVRGGISIQFIEQVGILVGYRLLEMDLSNDEFRFNGGLQGLFFAASLRF
jgi:hypothetical protein